jgi:hypothetical protein
MAEQKPVDVSKKYPSTEELSRLSREEQQRRLGGQATSNQPLGVEHGRQEAPQQRTRTPEEMAAAHAAPPGQARGQGLVQTAQGRRQPVLPPQTQRTLSPEEKAERLKAFQLAASQQGPAPPFEQKMAQDDPAWTPQHVGQGMRQPDGGPHEGFERRMERVLNAPHPHAVDYDRDGHGDGGAGRSARTIQNWHGRIDRAAQVKAALPQQVDRNRDGFPDSAVPGPDGLRQDQIGYRQRLRARRDNLNQQIEEGVAGFEGEAQLQVIDRPLPGDHTPNQVGAPGQANALADLTPLEQAKIAPQHPRTAPDARAVQVSGTGPPRMDAQGQPVQATRGPQGQAAVVSDPQGHAPPAATPNNPQQGAVQTTLPAGQPNPVSPAPHGGPAEPPRTHAATPAPAEAKVSPAATSPPAAPAQQAVPGQQHPTAQQSPPQQPQSRFVPGTPAPPPENAPKPADVPGRGQA